MAIAEGGAVVSSSTASSSTTATLTTYDNANDYRIRLGYLTNYQPATTTTTTTTSTDARYPGILAPLAATNGLMFPYTPSISNSQDVDYATMSMSHSNTDYHAFNHVPNMSIGITGRYTVQNYQEGIYALACIHFLRSVTRMYFGENDTSAGVPPPILSLNGYGTYMYNQIRVYVKSHSFNYEENMDTVNISLANGTVVLPAMFSLTVNLVVQNTPRAQRKDFTLDSFRSGSLMETTPNNSGWI